MQVFAHIFGTREERLVRQCKLAEASIIEELLQFVASLARQSAFRVGEGWTVHSDTAKLEHLADVAAFALVEMGVLRAKERGDSDARVLKQDRRSVARDLAIVASIQQDQLVRLAAGAVFLLRHIGSGRKDEELLSKARTLAGDELVMNADSSINGTPKGVRYFAVVIVDRVKKARQPVDAENSRFLQQLHA